MSSCFHTIDPMERRVYAYNSTTVPRGFEVTYRNRKSYLAYQMEPSVGVMLQ